MLTVGSLFAGIGGFDLGLERAGMRTLWQVELDPYCRAVLARHWPDVARYEDVHDVGAHNLAPVDVICGGFPCQPVSAAGQQRRQKDERWLWPEFARVIRELRPRYVLVENVPGLLAGGMGDVLRDLAKSGYDAEWDCVPAAAVGANHLRDRVWILAYPEGSTRGTGLLAGVTQAFWRDEPSNSGETVANSDESSEDAYATAGASRTPARERSGGELQDTDERALQSWRVGGRAAQAGGSEWWAVEPPVGRVAHGVPDRLDQLAALGNAVVPRVVERIGRLIADA